MDVNYALLNGKLGEEIYLEIEHGVNIDKKHGNVFRFRKSLYGLKKAARTWNMAIEKCLNGLVFFKSAAHASLQMLPKNNSLVFLLIYVDDVLLVGSDSNFLHYLTSQIGKKF